MRAIVILMLALPVIGCKEKPPPEDQNKGKNPIHVRRKDGGPSESLPGMMRDRALDIKDQVGASQIKQSLFADQLGGAPGPANDKAWADLLKPHEPLRELLREGGLQVYHNVKLGPANVVLLYEKDIEEGKFARYVLTADGTLHVMKKAQFDTLNKPR